MAVLISVQCFLTGTLPNTTEHDEKRQETPVIEVHEDEAVTSVPFSLLHEDEASSLVTVSGEADTTEVLVITGDTPTTELERTVAADGSVLGSEFSAPMNRPVDVQGRFFLFFLE